MSAGLSIRKVAHDASVLLLMGICVYAGQQGDDLRMGDPLGFLLAVAVVLAAALVLFLPRWDEDPRHRHVMAVVKSTYRPPTGGVRMKNASERLAREALMGMTTTSLRCRGCKHVQVVEAVGDARLPVEMPEDLL